MFRTPVWDALHSKSRIILEFFKGQGLAIVANVLYGLVCVRALGYGDYAQYSVLFGFMGSLNILLDIGASNSLAPIVGHRNNDLEFVSRCVSSIRLFSKKVFLWMMPCAIVFYLLLIKRQHWGARTAVLMVVALTVAGWLSRVSATYGVVLLLLRERRTYYKIQTLGAVGSLALLGVVVALHRVSIVWAVLFNLGQMLYIAYSNFRVVKGLVPHSRPSLEIVASARRLIMPSVPNIIFYALQGQVGLVLVVLFGHGVKSVASLGALNRLNQMFLLFNQMNPILVEPFFARLESRRVPRYYLLGLLLVGGIAVLVMLAVYFVPEVFLFPLGPKYMNLQYEAFLVAAGTAIRFVHGFLWVINSSRRFVYWWNNILVIVLSVLIQAWYLCFADLSNIRTVLGLSVAIGCGEFLVTVATSIYGFTVGPRALDTGKKA